jgi:hypothetical protein
MTHMAQGSMQGDVLAFPRLRLAVAGVCGWRSGKMSGVSKGDCEFRRICDESCPRPNGAKAKSQPHTINRAAATATIRTNNGRTDTRRHLQNSGPFPSPAKPTHSKPLNLRHRGPASTVSMHRVDAAHRRQRSDSRKLSQPPSHQRLT